MKVVAIGSAIRVYVGDMAVPKITANDSTYPGGSCGVRAHQSTATWDNFSVTPINPDAVYELEPQCAPGKRLDVSGASSANGTDVVIWSDNNSSAQGWTFQNQGDGTWELIPQCAPGARMETEGDNVGGSGANVAIWQDHNGSDSRWRLTSVGGDWYELTPMHNAGMRLDVYGAANADGANVHLWSSHGGTAQCWKLVPR